MPLFRSPRRAGLVSCSNAWRRPSFFERTCTNFNPYGSERYSYHLRETSPSYILNSLLLWIQFFFFTDTYTHCSYRLYTHILLLKNGWTMPCPRLMRLKTNWSYLNRPMLTKKKRHKDTLFHLAEVEKARKNVELALARFEKLLKRRKFL